MSPKFCCGCLIGEMAEWALVDLSEHLRSCDADSLLSYISAGNDST